MKAKLYVGTSGWHYNHWLGLFYPKNITGYNELRFHAEHFNSVENNSSFYRIASEATYKTWARMTPPGYKFSIKVNKFITHNHRLQLIPEVREKLQYVITATQVLRQQLGAIVIQLPPSFRYDIDKLETFLVYFTDIVRGHEYNFDVAIEFRHKDWFNDEVFVLLKKWNVALVAGQSSRYPEVRQLTADFAYIRMHGPEKLFASKYTDAQLTDWAAYIHSIARQTKRIYVYFNNDYHGYAIENAHQLMELCADLIPSTLVK